MTAKLLVVDDEPDLEVLIRQKFRRQVRKKIYDFYFARNGFEALRMLDEHPDIDVVLTDINMPEMDGLTLLVRLNELNPMIKAIIISAYGDMENIRTAMNRGAFDFITKPINFDDLEITITKTLNYVSQIKETIQSIKENNILKMYVDENVIKFMTRKEFEKNIMLNETINATVAFIDICSFTTISERHSADVVVNLLNSYFDVIVKEIINHTGLVDKFIGDAVMAIFKCDNHVAHALKAALTIRETVDTLIENNIDGTLYSPRVSIGINSGDMISGNIGSESLLRLDYTVIGDVVNTASRYQAIAKEGEIIIDENLYAKIQDTFECRRIGETPLKNKSKSVVIYNVLGLKADGADI